jgi:prolycopene isomerase
MARTAGEKNDFTIPGLTFCGGHHVRGDGYSSAYINGDAQAQKVIKKLKGGA